MNSNNNSNSSNNNSGSGIQSMDSDEVVSEGHGPDLLESQGESCDACASNACASNVWTYVDNVYSKNANAEMFNMEDVDFEVNPFMQDMQDMHHMPDMPDMPDTDIPIEEEILNLNNKVSNLLTLVQAKDAKVVQLENKVSSLTSIIDIMTKDGDETKEEDAIVKKNKKKEKKPGQTKTSAKLEFYKEYKDDPVVEEQVELFKKTFPQITKPPWQFRKAITDHMYKEAQ